jgi:predicted metal-binding protein
MDYVKKALEMGANHAAAFVIDDIIFDSRVILKCIFGCADYGKIHTCPYQKSPLSMDEYKKILQNYKRGIIIGCADKYQSQEISFEIERLAFLEGYYFAFSMSDCGLCEKCAKFGDNGSDGNGSECRFPQKARPAFHSVGIDVFKTVRRLGMPIDVLRQKEDEQNWYSAVFIE